MAESAAMSDSKETETSEAERGDATAVCKKSINNDETLSALSAISAAAANCMNSLKDFDASPTFSSPSPASTVARLEKAKRLDMLYNKMSINKIGLGENMGKDASSAAPSSPPLPPPRPEADASITK